VKRTRWADLRGGTGHHSAHPGIELSDKVTFPSGEALSAEMRVSDQPINRRIWAKRLVALSRLGQLLEDVV
jgi:hypothetical protein